MIYVRYNGTVIQSREDALRAFAECARSKPNYGSGCYAFVHEGVPLYVGQSRDVKRRFRSHELRFLTRIGGEFKCIPCVNHKEVERWLIAELKPRLNKRGVQ